MRTRACWVATRHRERGPGLEDLEFALSRNCAIALPCAREIPRRPTRRSAGKPARARRAKLWLQLSRRASYQTQPPAKRTSLVLVHGNCLIAATVLGNPRPLWSRQNNDGRTHRSSSRTRAPMTTSCGSFARRWKPFKFRFGWTPVTCVAAANLPRKSPKPSNPPATSSSCSAPAR